EEAGHLGGEAPSLFEETGAGVGDVRDDGAIGGAVARLEEGPTMSRRGQSRALQEAEEVRLTHVETFDLERGPDGGQGGPLAAEFAGPVRDRIALRGRLGPGQGRREEGVDVGVAGEVTDDRPDGIGMELEPPGDVIGGRGFEEIGAADLEAAVSGRRG